MITNRARTHRLARPAEKTLTIIFSLNKYFLINQFWKYELNLNDKLILIFKDPGPELELEFLALRVKV